MAIRLLILLISCSFLDLSLPNGYAKSSQSKIKKASQKKSKKVKKRRTRKRKVKKTSQKRRNKKSRSQKSRKKLKAKYKKRYKKTKNRRRASRSFASTGGDGLQKPIQVRGQSRNLNMNLIIKNEKDRINFIELREEYDTEVMETPF